MTTDELNALPIPTIVYVPTVSTVECFLFQGRVGVSDYYTLQTAPDEHGQISSKRPQYWHALDLLTATTDELAAWEVVAMQLQKQLAWIQAHKLANAAITL